MFVEFFSTPYLLDDLYSNLSPLFLFLLSALGICLMVGLSYWKKWSLVKAT